MSGKDRTKWNKRYRDDAYAQGVRPSELLETWIGRIPPGRALDVACGAGRNALYLATRGFSVDAVDISREGLNRARDSTRNPGLQVNWLEHDLDDPLPLDNLYQLILVIRYVNLPLLRRLTASLAPGGYLICEQHLVTDTEVTGPVSPSFRVKSGDLRAAAAGLRIHHLEETLVEEPDGRTAALARLVAQAS